jgi:hypothetical protein
VAVPAESRNLEKYQQRAIVAILVLAYAAMRAASALRSFHLFQRIEQLELDARRLAGVAEDGPVAALGHKQIVNDVATRRHTDEMKSYIDLLFLYLDRGALGREDRDELSRGVSVRPERRGDGAPRIAGRNQLCHAIRFTLGRHRFRVMRWRSGPLRRRLFLYLENALRRDG